MDNQEKKCCSWDWNENPHEVIEDISKAIFKLTENNIVPKIVEVNTQSDSYAVIIGSDKLTKEEAQKYYDSLDEDD